MFVLRKPSINTLRLYFAQANHLLRGKAARRWPRSYGLWRRGTAAPGFARSRVRLALPSGWRWWNRSVRQQVEFAGFLMRSISVGFCLRLRVNFKVAGVQNGASGVSRITPSKPECYGRPRNLALRFPSFAFCAWSFCACAVLARINVFCFRSSPALSADRRVAQLVDQVGDAATVVVGPWVMMMARMFCSLPRK